MLKVEKIQEKVELLDLEVQSNPCKIYWDDYNLAGRYDCLRDCTVGGTTLSPYASDLY